MFSHHCFITHAVTSTSALTTFSSNEMQIEDFTLMSCESDLLRRQWLTLREKGQSVKMLHFLWTEKPAVKSEPPKWYTFFLTVHVCRGQIPWPHFMSAANSNLYLWSVETQMTHLQMTPWVRGYIFFHCSNAPPECHSPSGSLSRTGQRPSSMYINLHSPQASGAFLLSE